MFKVNFADVKLLDHNWEKKKYVLYVMANPCYLHSKKKTFQNVK